MSDKKYQIYSMNDMCIPEPEDEEFKEIENLYCDFCSSERLKRIHPFIKDFKEIFGKYCKDTIIKLTPSKNVYRARIIDKEDIKKGLIGRTKLFKGYDEENSFVPPEIKCNAGRLNYKNQVFLYTAQEGLTAIMEVRPQLNQKVSLAKIEIKKELELLNLTHLYNLKTANYKREAFVDIISEALYTPINDDEKDKYINTQIIADIAREMGYDGIVHISSINKGGTNYCIFNYENCKPISSEIYIPNK